MRKRKLKFKYFRGSIKTWEKLFDEATDFANSVGEENVMNITTSCDHSDSVVTVWYWR